MAESSPLHLAIIPDGNRRWARGQGLFAWQGHERAVDNFRSILDWCRENPRIGTLTIWGFSTENWKRDPDEIAKLMSLFEKFMRKELPRFEEHQTRFLHSGRTDRIPASLAEVIAEAQQKTSQYTDFTFHLAVDYGGKNEVVRAIQRLENPSAATEEAVHAALDHPELPDIDIVLRTSGEQRTSNFFLWQTAYAEWMFIQKHFPELISGDVEEALRVFDARKRRFGGG